MHSRPSIVFTLCVMLLMSAISSFGKAADKPKGKSKPKPPKKLSALIIDGQNTYHDWKTTTPLLKKALESSGRFGKVDVATTPAGGQPMDDFKPHFADYDVVISNYDG